MPLRSALTLPLLLTLGTGFGSGTLGGVFAQAPAPTPAPPGEDSARVVTYAQVENPLGPRYYDPVLLDGRPFTGTLVDRRPDGRLAAWKQVRDGYADGRWLEWFPNGALRYRGAWRDGRQEGAHAYYFDNGLPREVGPMRAGGYAGVLTTYTRDGRVASRCGYLADTLVAPCLAYAAAAEVGEVVWAAPSTRAVETEAWPDRRPKLWREVDAAGRADGQWLEWTADGTLRFQSGWRAGRGRGCGQDVRMSRRVRSSVTPC